MDPELLSLAKQYAMVPISSKLYAAMANPTLLLLLLPVSSLFLQGAPELQPLFTLGVGGAIAALIFHFYRSDRKTSEERASADRKASEERIAGFAKDFMGIVQNNTAVITKLMDQQDPKPRRGAHGD